MRVLHILVSLVAPALAVAQQLDDNQPPAGAIRIEGRLTDEGVECQAMRAEDSTLYTLLGDLSGFEAGDEVEIQASRVEFSFCQQGQTLQVHAIRPKDRV